MFTPSWFSLRPTSDGSQIGEEKKSLEGMYYVNGIDKWKRSPALGYANFTIYNILIVLDMSQSSSITVKVYVTFGSIKSVDYSRTDYNALSKGIQDLQSYYQ